MLAAPEDQRRAPATTGHRAAAYDQHDTRRHTATSMMLMLRLRLPAAPRGSATGSSTNRRHRTISSLVGQINHTRAELSRAARGAPTQRRRSAERPAIRPTRWRRLLAAVADFLFAEFFFVER